MNLIRYCMCKLTIDTRVLSPSITEYLVHAVDVKTSKFEAQTNLSFVIVVVVSG